MMRVLSLGAGVQSSTLALMIAAGEVPMVDAAIFADTQWEPRKVYEWLNWLELQLPFPVYRVTAGNIRKNLMHNSQGQRFAAVPWFIISPSGKEGMGRRQCTSEYKLKPITRKTRELLGYLPRKRIPVGSCEMLIGISTDEALRQKPSRERWIKNVFPLLDAGMSRQGCLDWMGAHGYPLPEKSSCLGCPFHSDDQWREIKADPIAWADVLEVDAAIRMPNKMRGHQFMHADRIPLGDVDLLTPRERGQVDMFINECEGMCGV